MRHWLSCFDLRVIAAISRIRSVSPRSKSRGHALDCAWDREKTALSSTAMGINDVRGGVSQTEECKQLQRFPKAEMGRSHSLSTPCWPPMKLVCAAMIEAAREAALPGPIRPAKIAAIMCGSEQEN
jgi:hypothetical protein